MKYEILSHDSLEYIDKRLSELIKEKANIIPKLKPIEINKNIKL